MGKSKKGVDFQKEWQSISKLLNQYGNETMKVVKRGEKELIRLSKEGKLRIDAAGVNVKLEQLTYQIGREYIKSRFPGKKTAKLTKLVKDYKDALKEKKALDSKIKSAKK